MRTTILVGLLLFAATAVAEQEADKPVPVTEHHFRYEIGIEKTRTVTGWFEETDGRVRTVALDLDGDGKFEPQKLAVHQLPEGANGPEFIEMMFTVAHEDCEWILQYYDMFQVLPREEQDPASRFHFGWTVTKGDDGVSFGGERVAFRSTAAAVAKVDPVRVGGGFELFVTAGTQGPKALVNLSVKDAAGCRLSQVFRGGKTYTPTFTLSQDEEVKLSTTAPFG